MTIDEAKAEAVLRAITHGHTLGVWRNARPGEWTWYAACVDCYREAHIYYDGRIGGSAVAEPRCHGKVHVSAEKNGIEIGNAQPRLK